MKYLDRFKSALYQKDVDRPPVAIPTNTGIVDLMKSSNSFWPDAQKKSEDMTELALAAHKIAGIESVTIPFDMYVEVEAMGAKLEGWSLDKQPSPLPFIDSPEDLMNIKIPDPLTDCRLPVVLESTKILRKKVGNDLPIIVTVASPFEIVSNIWNLNTLVLYLEYDKKPLFDLLTRTTSFLSEYATLLFEAGADAISIIDGNSQNLFGVEMDIEYDFDGNYEYAFDGVEPGAENYEEFSGVFIEKFVNSIKGDTILHVCGDTTPVLDHMAETGVNGLSVDNVNIKEAKKIVGNEASIIGNISVNSLFSDNPSEIITKSRKALADGVDILAPGCNLIPTTSVGNLRALTKAALEL
jgi:[methyl-Co(III) methanol-specific corrinoid protein]:coenzyme M methyltransferase